MICRIDLMLMVIAWTLLHPVHAQEYPSRPVRVVIGSEPGSAPDTVARLLTQQLSSQMGQPFLMPRSGGSPSWRNSPA